MLCSIYLMKELPGTEGTGEPDGAITLREPCREAVVDRLLDLVQAMARATKVRLPEDLAGLTAHQVQALALLADGARSMGELCTRLGIAQSAGTALVTKLVAHGLVERHEDPADRRVVALRLTPEAAGIVARFQALRRDQARTLVAPLSDEELGQLLHIYETIAEAVRPPGGGASPTHTRAVGQSRDAGPSRDAGQTRDATRVMEGAR
jgi:DNA-binding MarR family transcriptional regulator